MMAISTRMFGLLAALVFVLVEVTTAEPLVLPMGGRLGVQQQFAGGNVVAKQSSFPYA